MKEIKPLPLTEAVQKIVNSSPDDLKELFIKFHQAVEALNLDVLTPHATKKNIVYKRSKVFIELKPQVACLRILLRTKSNEMNDPKHITSKKVNYWRNLTHVVKLFPEDLNVKYSMDNIMDLVHQSFEVSQ